MATSYKILGQSNPAATTATTLYTVPAGTNTVVSTLVICNQGTTGAAFRVAVRQAAATLATKQYLAYDTAIAPNDSISLTIGMTLAATDVVTIYASNTNLSFNLFGSEIT